MKKVFFTLVCLMLSLAAVAGEKNEAVYYGPEKGSMAISFSAVPALNFVGNMFNGTVKQSFNGVTGLGDSMFDGSTLDVKYYLNDRWGVTLGAGFNCLGVTSYDYDYEDALESKEKAADNAVLLSVGAQYLLRPGRRLQPVLGARLVYQFNSSVNKYTDMEDETDNFRTSYPTSTFGVIGDLGIEYFFTKNFSLGAVANLGLGLSVDRYKESGEDYSGEKIDISRKTTVRTMFATGQLGGNLSLNFYF